MPGCCRTFFPACLPWCCSCSRSRSISGNGWRSRRSPASIVMHVFVWPFTWNGGGGPVGSRYFLPFYALFLVLDPGDGRRSARRSTAFVVGALFTAQLVMNPFYVSLAPGHAHEIGRAADAADRTDAAARSSRRAGSRPDEASTSARPIRARRRWRISSTTIRSCRKKIPQSRRTGGSG